MTLLKYILLAPVALIGAALAAFAVMLFLIPTQAPAPMASFGDEAAAARRSAELPALQQARARDGAMLAYRLYEAPHPRAVAVLIHGSAGSSRDMNVLAHALADAGIASYAPDIRGQGETGRRGDIDYIGQQEDDVEDLTRLIRAAHPDAPLILIGHSSGGGFALKLAAKPQGRAFTRIILLAPYLGYDAPTTRPQSGGWAGANIPRIIALTTLERFHAPYFQDLPVIAFALPPGAETSADVTSTWSYRMMRGFAASERFADDVRALHAPLTVMVGAEDEIMFPDRFAPTLHAIDPRIDVRVLDGVDHLGLVYDPRALAAVTAAAAP